MLDEIKLYSFDVFDTVLTRTVMAPKDVFRLMHDRLSVVMPDAPRQLIREFWGARIWAEFVARRKSNQEDISFDAIYEAMACRYELSSPQCECLKNFELSVEKKVLVPVDGAREMLSAARKHGQVIFVSDMYLPEKFIRELLDRFELRAAGESVYVSGELGMTKGSGRLFKKIFSDFNLKPIEVVHCGDHFRSDVAVPKQLGMQIHPKCQIDGSRSGHGKFTYARDLLAARWRLGWRSDV